MRKVTGLILSVVLVGGGWMLATASQSTGQGDHHPRIPEKKMHFFDRQQLAVEDFEARGWILDIGGGGEGVIGRLKGKQVVAIDPNQRELEGAPDGPLKIVMDGLELKFLDNTFGTATCFFTLMYLEPADRPKLFREVYRVLQPGGRFLVWDVILPPRSNPEKEIAAFLFLFRLPSEEVKTGYGTRWYEQGFAMERHVGMANEAGFERMRQVKEGRTFFLELRK